MARRHKRAEHANHERWLVSYADFITLLFAFFVVMFASAEADRGKASRVSESVRKALEEGQVASALAGILGGTKDDRGQGNAMMMGPGGVRRTPKDTPPPHPVSLAGSLESLRSALKLEIERGQLQVRLEQRGLVISLREAAFFASGDDTIYPGTYPSIGKIAQAIRRLPNPVRLEGHTDSVPIHNSRFRNNWELSAARSVAMLELLESRFDVASARMAVAGYADTVPVESNETGEGRAHNRRVDIVILSESGASAEPKPAVAAGEAEPAPQSGGPPAHPPEPGAGAPKPSPE
jgi:chemotaxis protein MotB